MTQTREKARREHLCCWGYSGRYRRRTGLGATWNSQEECGSHKDMTTLCSGDKPYRKTDLHCLKRDGIQTTLLKRNRGKCQHLSPLRYIHFSLDPFKKYYPAVFPSHNMKNLSNSFPYEIDLLCFKTFRNSCSRQDLSPGASGKLAVHSVTQRHWRPRIRKRRWVKKTTFITYTDIWNVTVLSASVSHAQRT